MSDKDEVPGSSPGRPTAILPAQSATAPRTVALTACLGRTGAARPPHSQAQGPPGVGDPGPGPSRRAPIVVATGSAQLMVGLMPASMALTTCGAMPQMGCTARGRCSSTDGRSWRSTGVSWPARRSNLAGCPSAAHDDDQVQPDVVAGPARVAPAQRPQLGLGQLPEPFADIGRAARPRPLLAV